MRPTASPKEAAGSGATLLGFACAGGWALVVAVGYFANQNSITAHIPMFMAFAAAALGPIVLILFSAWAARDASRANSGIARVMAFAETAMIAPNADMIEDTRELAAALRTEVEALDNIVHVAAKRLDAFENGLRQDGGVLARALADDVVTMGRVRQELTAETIAISDAIARHVEMLKDVTAQVAEENMASAATLESQVEAFGAVSSRIGARSAEFAAAAAQSAGAAGLLDNAVEKALSALAHATSLTVTARQSAEEAANVAQEAAGAVRGATRTAVAEARDAAKRIRAEAAQPLARVLSGAPSNENIIPPPEAAAPRSGADVIEMKRPAPPRAPAAPPRADERDLVGIVSDSGVWIAEALSSHALERISLAAARGADSRRDAVRFAAPQALRKISAHLRRDAGARRDAENLRREPGRALGAQTDSAARRRDLASAYLLIDAVLC